MDIGLHTVVTVEAFTDLRQLHFHNGTHRCLRQRTVNHRLEARQQRGLEVVPQDRTQQFMQVGLCRLRLFLQHLHDEVAAEIRGHQNHRVAEVNFPSLAVAHEAPVKHLVEQVHHVPVRLFHFIQQHHAVRALTDGFGQNAALTVTHVARR